MPRTTNLCVSGFEMRRDERSAGWYELRQAGRGDGDATIVGARRATLSSPTLQNIVAGEQGRT
jgi:hypothetical protein